MSSKRKPLQLAVLASGRGSNLQAILEAIREGKLSARVAVVISDNPEALALERARQQGLPALLVKPQAYSSKAAYEQKLVEICKSYQVELVVLAGYMRLLSSTFLKHFLNRVVNIHPALLPAFIGLNAQHQALEYGVRFSGCTVHFVDNGMDTGPILLQAVVPVCPHDTEDTLAARILVQEHRIYPLALELIAQGQVHLEGRRVWIEDWEKGSVNLWPGIVP